MSEKTKDAFARATDGTTELDIVVPLDCGNLADGLQELGRIFDTDSDSMIGSIKRKIDPTVNILRVGDMLGIKVTVDAARTLARFEGAIEGALQEIPEGIGAEKITAELEEIFTQLEENASPEVNELADNLRTLLDRAEPGETAREFLQRRLDDIKNTVDEIGVQCIEKGGFEVFPKETLDHLRSSPSIQDELDKMMPETKEPIPVNKGMIA